MCDIIGIVVYEAHFLHMLTNVLSFGAGCFHICNTLLSSAHTHFIASKFRNILTKPAIHKMAHTLTLTNIKRFLRKQHTHQIIAAKIENQNKTRNQKFHRSICF